MTIQQLIHKLKIATNENWGYTMLEEGMPGMISEPSSEAYNVMVDGKGHHIITKSYIEPLSPESFVTKELVDFIISVKDSYDRVFSGIKNGLEE